MKFPFKIICFCLLPFLGFSQETNPEAPKEIYNVIVTMPKITSTISLPIHISLADIEKQTNTSLTGLLYEDASRTDNGDDDFRCKVWKRGDIKITPLANNHYGIEVPLKIWAEKGYGALGYAQYKSTEFEMVMKFITQFSIKPDWTVQTTTLPNGYDWISKPVLKFGVVEIPVAPIIGKVINSKHQGFSNDIDKAIAQKMVVKPYIVDAWNKLSSPYLVSESYNTWLKITPLEIMMTPLQSVGKNIKATVGFKINTQTFTGLKPVPPAMVVNIPNLKYATTIPTDFEMAVVSNIPYTEATTMAKKMFLGKEFAEGSRKITVTDISIYASKEYLVIKTDIVGSVNGTVYVKGIPVYDAAKKMVVLTQTDFDLKTKNFLYKVGAWLLQSRMEKKIENDFGMPMQELLTLSKQNAEAAMNKTYKKGVTLSGQVQEINPKSIILTEQGINVIINAKAKLNLLVDGI